MARQYSKKTYTVNDFVFTLRFEAEELSEKGLVVDYNELEPINAYLKETFSAERENTLEQVAQEIYEHVEHELTCDPSNTYKNLVGDEYPRVRLVSVDVTQNDSYTASYGD